MDHINGRLGKDPATGLWTLELIRDDYDPATLPVLDASNIISLDSFDRPGYGELINELCYIRDFDPDAEIEVALGIGNRVKVLADDYVAQMDTEDDVNQLIADHWQDWIDDVAMQLPSE